MDLNGCCGLRVGEGIWVYGFCCVVMSLCLVEVVWASGCMCSVPGLIRLAWCGRLCFEVFCGLCGCFESSVCCVFGCHGLLYGTHAMFATWGVVLLCLCLFVVFSEYWCSCGVVCCAEFSVCGGLPGWASLGGVLCDICI